MAVMTEVGFHLHPPPSPSRHSFLPLHTQNPLCHFHCRPISISNHRFFLLLSPWPLHIRRSRWWDSNAESYNTKNFNFDPNEESEDFDDSIEQWVEVLEDYIDSIWIFKVIMKLYCVNYEFWYVGFSINLDLELIQRMFCVSVEFKFGVYLCHYKVINLSLHCLYCILTLDCI